MRRSLLCVERNLGAVWRRLDAIAEVPVEAAAIFRIVYGLFVLAFIVSPLSWLGSVPRTFFDPPYLSLANLTDGFPSAAFFRVYDFVAPVLLLLITLGVKPRWFGCGSVVLSLLASNFQYSFGKIDHHILLWITLLCFSFSNWGTRLAHLPDKARRNHQRPITVLAVCIGFALLTAGFETALIWVDFDSHTSGFFSWFYVAYYGWAHTALLAPLVFKLPPLLLEAGDYIVVAFETTGLIFPLLGRRWWLSWLTAACVFHMLNILSLQIPFVSHAIVYLPFFLPVVIRRRAFAAAMTLGSWRLGMAFLLATVLTGYHLRDCLVPSVLSAGVAEGKGVLTNVSSTTALLLYLILAGMGFFSLWRLRNDAKARLVSPTVLQPEHV